MWGSIARDNTGAGLMLGQGIEIAFLFTGYTSEPLSEWAQKIQALLK